MEIKLERLKENDYSELVNLLNKVFTIQNNKDMDFESIFPRVFVKTDETMGWHMGAKADGKLVGVAASYPLTYRVGGCDLKVSAAGNVAVDNSMRGQGIMQSILNKLDEEDRANGFDLSYLHGDRFRYRNFGYERCGIEFYFTLSKRLMGKDAPAKYKYINLRDADDSFITKVYEFSGLNETGIKRDEKDFMPALTAHGKMPFAIIDENENIAGYFSAMPNTHTIEEIFIKDKADFCNIFAGYMEEMEIVKSDLRLPAYSSLLPMAHFYSDRYLVRQPANFRIYNFKRVVEAFMKEKAKYSYMADGNLTLNSEIFGAWCIEKKGDTISVEPFEGKARFELPGYSVYPFLFGTFMPREEKYKPEEEFLLKTWLPIPLYCPDLT